MPNIELALLNLSKVDNSKQGLKSAESVHY